MPLIYQNPMPIKNLGDPFVLRTPDGTYYCYATSVSDGFKAWSSDNLVFGRKKDTSTLAQKTPGALLISGRPKLFFRRADITCITVRAGVKIRACVSAENIVDGRHESHLYAAKLKDDLVAFEDVPLLITKPDQEWELRSGPEWFWNEGPFMLKHNGKYYTRVTTKFNTVSSCSQ